MNTMTHLAAELGSRPWALTPAAHQQLQRQAVSGQMASARRSAAAPKAKTPGVEVVSVAGYLTQRSSILTMLGLGTSCEAIGRQVQLALLDDGIDAIVLDIDCQGGETYGMTELAATLRAARTQKPVVGVANSVAAGAGYWIGASCGSLYITPGGELGGIGMSMVHEDASRSLEKAGISVSLIHAGKYKVEGHPFGPLDAEARKFMQATADRHLSTMVSDVAAGRKVPAARVRSDFGQGRIVGAKDAKAAGMVDGIRTLADVVDDLKRGGGGSGRSRLAAEVTLARAMRGV